MRLVADAAEIQKDDLVIEVGPGTGTLTEELLLRARHVIAVEIDRDLASLLRQRHGDNPKFQLIEGDALAGKHGLNEDLLHVIRHANAQGSGPHLKLIANLPYNIASPLVIEMLLAGVDMLTFTVQKEVADRLRAPADGEAYGPLSAMAQLLSDVEVLRTLPPQAFWPAPKIDSALVRMKRRDRLGQHARDFGRFVHAVFSSRRKTLRKALAQAGYVPEALLAHTGIPGDWRAERLTPEQLFSLFQAAKTEPPASQGGWS